LQGFIRSNNGGHEEVNDKKEITGRTVPFGQIKIQVPVNEFIRHLNYNK
jgi:hypothetical protein